MFFAQVNEQLEKAKGDPNLWIYVAAGVGVLVALFVLFKIATGRKKKHPDLERGQREDLAEYPPPPPPGSKRLTAKGEPVRVRLIVICPTGKAQDPISMDEVPELLDEVLRNLGIFIKTDKPRVKIWPTQLSVAGFAPTFHRLVVSPDAGKKSSRWIKVAGPAKAGGRPILLGMALLTDDPCKMGDIHVQISDWNEVLRVER
ncbi:MAG: hypothetical protein EXS09_00425 [Gemmataceae bacterium]|nr:hypothetical protein [Gemmataceae bacterium]